MTPSDYTPTPDWDLIERHQLQAAQAFADDTGWHERPLLVSDWRHTWEAQRKLGISREELLEQLEQLRAIPEELRRHGSLSNELLLALFEQEWPEDN